MSVGERLEGVRFALNRAIRSAGEDEHGGAELGDHLAETHALLVAVMEDLGLWTTPDGGSRPRRFLEINGEVRSQAEWARRTGKSPQVIYARLKMGWSAEDSVLTPVGRSRGERGG